MDLRGGEGGAVIVDLVDKGVGDMDANQGGDRVTYVNRDGTAVSPKLIGKASRTAETAATVTVAPPSSSGSPPAYGWNARESEVSVVQRSSTPSFQNRVTWRTMVVVSIA